MKITGIAGSFKYKNTDSYALYTQEESLNISNNLPEADILITHDKAFIEDTDYPAHDCFKGITEYIYCNHILLHIHGHIHEENEEILKNGTKSTCLYMAEVMTI